MNANNAWLQLGGTLGVHQLPQRQAMAPIQGPSVGFVTDSDINDLNAAIQQLTADVNTAVSRLQKADPALISLQMGMVDIGARWAQWVSDHTGFISRTYSDGDLAAFRLEYGAKRNQFVNLGQKTKAMAIGADGSLGKGITWWVPAGMGLLALGIVLYLVAPGILLRIGAKKALAAGAL